MNAQDLKVLSDLARLVAERDLSKLSALTARSAELAKEADAIKAQGATYAPESLSPAVHSAVGRLWERWRDAELRRIQLARAEIAARQALAKDVAARSYGRQIALSELAKR